MLLHSAATKNPGAPGFFWSSQENLRFPDVGGLLALGTLGDFKLDPLAFLQGFEATHLDCGEVRKQIFAAVVWRNESKTFSVVKPFHNTCCHFTFLKLSHMSDCSIYRNKEKGPT
jgi:hypothetical protein